MSIPSIDRTTIQRNATTQSFTRGEGYYQAEAVAVVTQRGNMLQAEVEGTEPMPYRVTVQFEAGDVTAALCTCSYSLEGWCKHIVATLLTCVHQPETIETRPSLEQLLDKLNLNQAKQVFRELIVEHPNLIDDLDFQVSLITAVPATPASPASPKPTQRTIDPAIYRRKVRQAFREAVNRWENGYDDDPVAEELLDILADAEEFFDNDDGENAIAVLEGIMQGCVDGWEEVDNYGADSDEIIERLDYAWTQAILIIELTDERQTQLRSQLDAWQSQWGQELSMTMAALSQGWSYPPLLRVLNGEITKFGAWEGESPNFADDLASIRLEILARQEREQEYLYLAQAEGQTEAYLTMLARLGRVEEAMTAAGNQMRTVAEAFALAKNLRQQGSVEQALEIAQTGLNLEGHPLYDLAIWTSDLAEAQGKPQVALTARIAAFKAEPSFQDYQKIEQLAGAGWAGLRPDLLQTLSQHSSYGLSAAKVDIFLHEGEIDSPRRGFANEPLEQSQISVIMKQP
jgi:uncharacterized Zn finger protein